MCKFSRWMPPLTKPPLTVSDHIILGFFIVPLLILGAVAALPLVILSNFWAFLWKEECPLTRIASERAGEDIGTFARAFDRRTAPFDPWVVRAIWDALQDYFVGMPFRPTDRLVEDFGID